MQSNSRVAERNGSALGGCLGGRTCTVVLMRARVARVHSGCRKVQYMQCAFLIDRLERATFRIEALANAQACFNVYQAYFERLSARRRDAGGFHCLVIRSVD